MDPDPRQATKRRVSRRDLVVGGAVGAAVGAAAVGTAWAVADEPTAAPAGATEPEEPPPTKRLRFHSTQLTAPEATAWTKEGATPAAGLLFTTPRDPEFHGVVYDDRGQPVWIEPSGTQVLELRVQRYRGRPVLTYWTGQVKEGLGFGKGVLLDEQYQVVAEVWAGNGILADFHEFRITDDGTALFTAYPRLPADLSAVGGPEDGWIHGARVQEVDIASGEVLLDWEGVDHIDLSESHRPIEDGEGESPERPWDPIHANSVAPDGDHLLVSARHTSTVYRVDRRTGQVTWRLGGANSDFEIPEDATFGWQHDAQRQPDGTITIYDNHSNKMNSDDVSAALRLRVDEAAMTVELVEALRHEDRYGYAMGNAQVLADGHVLVGWGMDPYATEFDADGQVVFELGGLAGGSYRSYRHEWRGRPVTKPDLAVAEGQAHASWNGATEVARWHFLHGGPRGPLRPLTMLDRDGFETSVDLPSESRRVRVEALDSTGRVLGSSRTVAVAT
jgi:hypothetical protein